MQSRVGWLRNKPRGVLQSLAEAPHLSPTVVVEAGGNICSTLRTTGA
jgi:hypothetical protein